MNSRYPGMCHPRAAFKHTAVLLVFAWVGFFGAGSARAQAGSDLNAYLQESPVQALKAAGCTSLIEAFGDAQAAYSYVFDGQAGTLDHALATSSMAQQVSAVAEWHVNADEADGLDYNLDFGRNPAIFNGADPYRNSDHDPLVVGLRLSSALCDCNAPGAILGSEASDALFGTTGADVICGFGGDDIIFGLGGDDCVMAGAGHDFVVGGRGNDSVDGGADDDVLLGGLGDDFLDGGEGEDAAFGGLGADECTAERQLSCP